MSQKQDNDKEIGSPSMTADRKRREKMKTTFFVIRVADYFPSESLPTS